MTIQAKIIHWLPRVLGILFVFFIAIFALDVFDEKLKFYQLIIAFLIHLIPSYILIIVLLIAWRNELFGSILYAALAIFYLIITGAKFSFIVYLIMMGCLFLISILFLVSFKTKQKNKVESAV